MLAVTGGRAMLVVMVHVEVKPDSLEGFREATVRNAEASRLEPGVVRFDVLQSEDNPQQFLLTEVYRDEEAAGAHKCTAHYLTWRDAVAEMMVVPRHSRKYHAVSFGADGR
jgi:quinol monooxygenase YgiN